MILTSIQVLETIENPTSKKQIASVKRQESRLRVYTEELDEDELNSEDYWSRFKETMKARSSKKFDRVFQFARYPLPVAQISDSILSDFYKVFDGKNRHFHLDGDRDLSVLQKWVEDSNLEKWIENNAKAVFKNKPCSFVVVDIDKNGKPYLILVDSDRLIDAKIKNSKGECEYITFLHSEGQTEAGEAFTRYAVYDDAIYYVVEKIGSGEYTIITENPHNIGYCPARAFISQPANSKNYFKRRVAFSPALSKFEDWTLFDIFRNFTDHYAPFPVTESAKKKCPNPDCTSGKIVTEIIDDPKFPDVFRTVLTDCKFCEENDGQHIMPGTHIGINVSADKDRKDGAGVFRMIFPEVDKLEYVPKKLDELELEIRHKTVGLNYMASTNEAMNQMQLKGSFASMESVLIRTKEELDRLYKWIVTTVAKSMYTDIKITVDADFGTEFYLISEEDLQARFKEAKAIGLPQEEQMMIYLQLIDTKYKGNPNKVARQKMLVRLDPMPLYTTKEVLELAGKNLIDPATLSMKINFLNFVSRFEMENVPITQFGLNLPPDKRLEKIKDEFDIYNVEIMAKITPIVVPPVEQEV